MEPILTPAEDYAPVHEDTPISIRGLTCFLLATVSHGTGTGAVVDFGDGNLQLQPKSGLILLIL